jgi:molecular chaperone DnaJ
MQRMTRRLSISVPAGVEDGVQISAAGKGDVGPHSAPPGNLYVSVSVKPHILFQRQGNDLTYTLPINFAQAALGDELDVPTLDGTAAKLRVPPGTQNGRILRLKGKGVPYLGSNGRGDLQVTVKVSVPTRLTEEQKELLRKLSQTFETEAKPDDGKGIFNRVFGRN